MVVLNPMVTGERPKRINPLHNFVSISKLTYYLTANIADIDFLSISYLRDPSRLTKVVVL